MKKKVIIIVSVIVIGVAGIGGFMAINSNSHNASAINEIYVEADTAVKQQVISTVEATGNIVFSDKTSIYSENSGKVLNIPVKEGEYVSKGQVIINYDKTALDSLKRQLEEANLNLKSAQLALDALYIPTDDVSLTQLETQIAQTEKNIDDARNTISQLEVNIAKAQTDLDNANILYDQGVISLIELRNYQTTLDNYNNQKVSADSNLTVLLQQLEYNQKQYESAQNSTNAQSTQNKIASQKVVVQQAQLKVNQLQQDINDYAINVTAPTSGTITKIYVSDGESVSENKMVAQISNLDALLIEAYIPEYDMDGVEVGQSVLIKSDSSNETFEGKVTKIYPIAEKTTISGTEKNAVKIEISIPENSGLKSGYSVDITITTDIDDNALVIPSLAYMTETNEDPYVFVIKDDNTLEKRRIKLKTFVGALVSVEGLNEGERVVSAPDESLYDGASVVVIGGN